MPKYPKRFDVRRVKNARIAMSDGATIATDLTLPDAEGRFPVVLEYLPYRKDDIMAYRQQRHVYFAERGFACAWLTFAYGRLGRRGDRRISTRSSETPARLSPGSPTSAGRMATWA